MQKVLGFLFALCFSLCFAGDVFADSCPAGYTPHVENKYVCDCSDCGSHLQYGVCTCGQCSTTTCVCQNSPCGPQPTTTVCGSGYYACNTGCCPVGVPTTPPVAPTGGGGCTPSCPSGCGEGNNLDGCGGTCSCIECVSCVIRCGQAKSCGGNCPSDDLGTPATPDLISPNGTLAAPTKVTVVNVPLSWTAETHAVAYNVDVYNSSDTLVWSTVVEGSTTTTTAALAVANVYHWRVQAVNTICLGAASAWSNDGYFNIGSAPTITNLVIRNSDDQIVTVDSSGRANSCEEEITTSSRPKEIHVTATVSDLDGWADVQSVSFRWGGSVTVLPMTIVAGSGNTLTATLVIDMSTWTYSSTDRPFQVLATDSFGLNNNWVAAYTPSSSSVTSFKYWDCRIRVSGTIFDGSGVVQNCSTGDGFTVPVQSKFNFLSIGYTEVAPSVSSVPMNVSPPATYTDNGTDFVLWGRDYQSVFNSEAEGTAQLIRMIDRGDAGANKMTCYPTNQITMDGSAVNPYSTNPTAQIDHSFIANQEPWFQVVGAGVIAATRLETNVPVTCPLNPATCKAATSVNGALTDGGILSAAVVTTNSGCDLSGPCKYGETNDWSKETTVLSANDKLSYKSIMNRYLGTNGIGTTIDGNSNMTAVLAASSGAGVVFVNGDLDVDVNNTVPVGNFLMIVVKGSIVFEQNVTKSAGIFIADAGIRTIGSSVDQLVIDGILFSTGTAPTGNIRFIRGYDTKSYNNTHPATVVNYRPDFVFNMPGKVYRVLTGWNTAL